MGFTYQMLQFQEERLIAASNSLVPLSTALSETIEYLKQRTAFGQPLINNQYIHFRLAELHTEVEMFRQALFLDTIFGGFFSCIDNVTDSDINGSSKIFRASELISFYQVIFSKSVF